jgi:hypothetical protein
MATGGSLRQAGTENSRSHAVDGLAPTGRRVRDPKPAARTAPDLAAADGDRNTFTSRSAFELRATALKLE